MWLALPLFCTDHHADNGNGVAGTFSNSCISVFSPIFLCVFVEMAKVACEAVSIWFRKWFLACFGLVSWCVFSASETTCETR
jgi:hypothetical protein